MELVIMGLITIIGIAVDIAFIRAERAEQWKKSVVLKGTASFMFVLLGGYLYYSYRLTEGMLILIGLILGMLGDILLNLRYVVEEKISNKVFAVGILSFLLGHFLYIAALIESAAAQGRGGRAVVYAVILTAVLAVLSIPPLIRSITAPSQGLKMFGYVYLTVVIAMFNFAVALLIVTGVSAFAVVFTIGALCFMVSDFIMIYYSFGKKIEVLRAANLLTYYVGQILIAICIMLA